MSLVRELNEEPQNP
jgi:hypothetical protein